MTQGGKEKKVEVGRGKWERGIGKSENRIGKSKIG
jgi:hypothetical protein